MPKPFKAYLEISELPIHAYDVGSAAGPTSCNSHIDLAGAMERTYSSGGRLRNSGEEKIDDRMVSRRRQLVNMGIAQLNVPSALSQRIMLPVRRRPGS